MCTRIIVLTLLFFCNYSRLKSQSIPHCATVEYNNTIQNVNPSILKNQIEFERLVQEKIRQKRAGRVATTSGTVYRIPVVVHVIHNNSSGIIGGHQNSNISDEQIRSQIDVLNEDYRRKEGTLGFNTNPVGADMEIEFCLASRDPQGNYCSGILRKYNTAASFTPNDDKYLKSLSYWPNDQYLNIWTTTLTDTDGSLLLGYSHYPGGSGLPGLAPVDGEALTDGIVILHKAFGRNTGTVSKPYNLGRTATHEIGHWLGGLLHPWGDSYCGNDFVDDTPAQQDANYEAGCQMKTSVCNGKSSIDMIENYMQYTGDKCMNIFTRDQKLRMRTVLETSPARVAILSSPGCCFGNTLAQLPQQQDFEGDIYSDGWQVQVGSGASWKVGMPGAYGQSSKSIYIKSDSAHLRLHDYFQTPYLSFQDIAHPQLKFDMAYAVDALLATDSLAVSYSLNCLEWKPLLKLSGRQGTNGLGAGGDFVPENNEWQTLKIDLNFLAFKPAVQFRFENISSGAGSMYIDNISIYKVSEVLEVKLYPNPASEEVFVQVALPEETDVYAVLYNDLGEKMWESTDDNEVGYIKKLRLGTMASGMYLLRIVANGQSVTRKIVVEK